jgi:hypothetical protein
MIAQERISAGRTQTRGQFIGFTVVAAVTAATAALASVTLSLPLWAMFIGWVAYFTRRPSARDGLANLTCLVLGLALGIGASLAIATLMPKFGVASIAIVVFVVATIVMSLRVVPIPIANNILSYFLGLIGYFASRQEAALSTFVELGATFALGSFAAWIANTIQSRLTQAA